VDEPKSGPTKRRNWRAALSPTARKFMLLTSQRQKQLHTIEKDCSLARVALIYSESAHA